MSRGSHSPSLLTQVSRTLKEDCDLAPNERILVAVSGGGDSQALLDVLARLQPQFGYELHAHGVDHGLRAEAAGELALAQLLAESLGVPFTSTRLQLTDGGNLQERARDARYEALDAVAEKLHFTSLATAHHADDRAETVLQRLLRGAGPPGLGVLPARDDSRIRPFLRSRKSAIISHLQRHELTFANDPSNRDSRFLRVRVRNELIPLMESLSPRIVEHLNGLADDLLEEPLEGLSDRQGRPILLKRSQIEALRRARRLGQRHLSVPIDEKTEAGFSEQTGKLELRNARSWRKKPPGS